MMESDAIQKTAQRVGRLRRHHGLGNLREHRGNWWLDLTHEKNIESSSDPSSCWRSASAPDCRCKDPSR